VRHGDRLVRTVDLDRCIPHNYTLCVAFDGKDVWVGTSKGLARAKGDAYYEGLRAAKGGAN
jgi:hypothetical protein